MSYKVTLQDEPLDFLMVTTVAKSLYDDYTSLVKPTEPLGWDNLPQEARDHYIYEALRFFGVELD